MKLKKSKKHNPLCHSREIYPLGSGNPRLDKKSEICKQVSQIYDWLDSQIKSLNAECSACGKCCDFDAFGHKLFITTPELLYFKKNIVISSEVPIHRDGVEKSIQKNICPYLKDGKCTARDFRFAGCRIFFCKADSEKINELSEQAIEKFKTLCDEYNFPYRYMELSAALNPFDIGKNSGFEH
jgi:Fe-S-cluster containining protein